MDSTQRARLQSLLTAILPDNLFYRKKYAAISVDAAMTDIATLPLTTRAEIEADQLAQPPFGTNLTYPVTRYNRLHQTSGSQGAPLRWLDTPESWAWWKSCWGRVYDGAGITADDRVMFAFSFGPFIGFWSAFESAAERGCLCLPAGGMSSQARVRFLIDNGATVLCCTPTYALHLADVARDAGLNTAGSAIRAVIVAGEPGGNIPATRTSIESAWGARVFDHAGMTEIGAWGYETFDRPGGLFVNEREFIAEVIDPKSLAPVVAGYLGELVLTNLGRVGSPLIRYRTGDLVRRESWDGAPGSEKVLWLAGGVLGRADDMLIIRGNNVFPSAIEGILRGVTGVAEFRLLVGSRSAMDELSIEIEPRSDAQAGEVVAAAAAEIRARLGFRVDVRAVAAGSLPRFELKARRVVRAP